MGALPPTTAMPAGQLTSARLMRGRFRFAEGTKLLSLLNFVLPLEEDQQFRGKVKSHNKLIVHTASYEQIFS